MSPLIRAPVPKHYLLSFMKLIESPKDVNDPNKRERFHLRLKRASQ